MPTAELMTTIPELLSELIERRGVSERQVAAYLDVSAGAVNRWMKGLSTPDPRYCWKIAELTHTPIEDVMRMAGHLPALTEPVSEPTVPPWLEGVLSELDPYELDVVGKTAQTLLELREERAKYGAAAPPSPGDEPPAPTPPVAPSR